MEGANHITPRRVSEFLQGTLDMHDRGMREEEGVTAEDEEAERIVTVVAAESVETLMPAELEEHLALLWEDKEHVGDLLDSYYTRRWLQQAPRIVKRALTLNRIYPTNPLPDLAVGYLREATRAYLFGLVHASLAMSRSALEEGLKDSLRQFSSAFSGVTDLKDLIEAARMARLVTDELAGEAHEVRGNGNSALHRKKCDDKMAYESLQKVREVLEHLYSED